MIIYVNNYDVIITLNLLYHVKMNTEETNFKNYKETLFEINDKELDDVNNYAKINNFALISKVELYRKTIFGNSFILYFKLY